MKNPVVYFAEHLRARHTDLRVALCRLVEHVFRDVGLSWSEISVVRTRDRSRYACLVAVSPDCMVQTHLELAAVRAACLAWERLRLRMSTKDFYWRVQEDGRREVKRKGDRHAAA